jgi:hypothetical protein
MSLFVKIYLDQQFGSCQAMRAIVPGLKERFFDIAFEVVEFPIPEIDTYPRLIIWKRNDEGRVHKRLELRGYRTEQEVEAILSAVLESDYVCRLAS